MKYAIARAESAEELEKEVATWLELGYVPQGGIAITGVFSQWENNRKGSTESKTDWSWAQAMVLHTDNGEMKS